MHTTADLQRWLDLLHAGDGQACDRLLARSCERLRLLARRMLWGFPLVRDYEDTDDVLNGVVLRLHRCLGQMKPRSLRHYFSLAGQAARRELLDLAKKYRRVGAREVRVPADSSILGEWPSPQDGPADLAQWTEFHERVAGLPEEEREVVTLLWYQGLTQAEAAAVLGVAERTVLRRWYAARLRLREVFSDGPPG